MCHTGRPLRGPGKHCSVAALITVGMRELGGGGGGGGWKNRGDIGMEKIDMEIEPRRWTGERLRVGGEEARRAARMKIPSTYAEIQNW